ncbi:MAG: hypothetical protein JRN73_02675 [Nitrososphaerota archaeon]|nr:hypothetical protein [Nitrososphaerota archaeon]
MTRASQGGEEPAAGRETDVTIAAVILSLIAGVVIMADSLSALAFASPALHYGTSQSFRGLPYYYWFGPYIFGLGNMYWFYIFAFVNLVSGVAIAAAAGMLYFRPGRATLWGTVILLFSIIGFIGVGNFFITQFLGVIGGVIGIAYGRHQSISALGGAQAAAPQS